MQPVGLTTLLLQLFLVLTLLSSAIIARPFTDEQFLQNFIDEGVRQPVGYLKFENSDSVPYYRTGGIKRQIQAFADPQSKMKAAAHMLRAMINFRRY
jgi:hypothetical protein